jgi:hypothetical protein
VTNIPPTSDSRGRNIFQRLAHTSWVAPLCAIGMGAIILVAQGGTAGPASRIQSIVGPALILLGVVSGVIALAGMGKVGRRGILFPALIGTTVSLVLVGMAIMPFLMRSKPSVLQPLVHANGHRVLKDDKLGLALDIPEGFAEFPAGKQIQRADHVFVKGDTTDRELDLLFSVSALPAALSKARLQPGAVSGKTNVTVRTFNWRGLEVDGLVVSENLLGTPFTTFNIQLPTLPRAVQISLAGPTARQAELEGIAATLLPSIDGKSNW